MTNVTRNVNPNGYAISTVAMDHSDATGSTAYVGIMGFSTPGYPTSACVEDGERGRELDGLDWAGDDGTAGRSGERFAGGCAGGGSDLRGDRRWRFCESRRALRAGRKLVPAPGPGVFGISAECSGDGAAIFNPDAGTKTLVASTYGRGIWNYALVASPDYTNVISNSPQTVFPAQTVTFNGALTARNGYASAVNLSCTGAAPATCTRSRSRQRSQEIPPRRIR